jgi:hypothetical protein
MIFSTARHLILGETRVILCRKTFAPTQGRFSPSKGRMSKKGENLSTSERKRDSLHVEIQYIFYRVIFSTKQRESIYFRENRSF